MEKNKYAYIYISERQLGWCAGGYLRGESSCSVKREKKRERKKERKKKETEAAHHETFQASKMTSTEQFAALSKIKLENARKLVKPELAIDETSPRQVVVDPSSKTKEEDQKPSDSAVDEDQKVFKVTRKIRPTVTENLPATGQKTSTKSDWKPSKLRKNFKEPQALTSRYKQSHIYSPRPKLPLLTTTTPTTTEKSPIEENDVEHTTKSARVGRYQDFKHKFVPKPRGLKLRGPKPSHIDGLIEDNHHLITTTKPPPTEKSRKTTFTPRKNEKNYVEDIKAVALKLRKNLESLEKSTARPPRRIDSSEGSTTLLTTMRTVKSFSFSTRLVKMDDNEATASSTMKMLEEEPTTPTSSVPSSTSSSVVTEIVTLSPNEVTTSSYESVLGSSNRPTSPTDDVANEIENSSDSPAVKSTRSPQDLGPDWAALSTVSDSVTNRVDYKPRAAALVNDSGSPVFVVYPSATEKPIAITPKVGRYHATVTTGKEPIQQQQSVMQDPIISVRVSNGTDLGVYNNGASGSLSAVGTTNIFNPTRSAAILESTNNTLLEQLRSTVAPLLSTLGGKSPVFSGVYKNTNSAVSIAFYGVDSSLLIAVLFVNFILN